MLGTTVRRGATALHPLGIIEHVPEPPLPGLDGDKVDAAPEAYAMLSMPDAVPGLASYALTLGLAPFRGEARATERPWIPLALAAKVTFDGLEALRPNAGGWRENRAICLSSLVYAAATFATGPLVVPEAHVALRRLLDGGTPR